MEFRRQQFSVGAGDAEDQQAAGVAEHRSAHRWCQSVEVLTYRNGKPQSRKLGNYPAMKLAQARAQARDYWENPEKFAVQAEVGSFKQEAENWFKRHVQAKRLRSHTNIRAHLDKYIYPKWKDRKFLEIRRGDVSDLLDHVEGDCSLLGA